MKRGQLPLTNYFRKGKAKQADVWRLHAHLLLFFLLGNLQSWWVGEGGGLTVGAVLHLGHLKKMTKPPPLNFMICVSDNEQDEL